MKTFFEAATLLPDNFIGKLKNNKCLPISANAL